MTWAGVLLGDKEGNYAVAPISSGLVLEMVVKPGDHVEAGAEIASIEQKLLSAQIQNAIAQVDRLEANLAQLKAAKAVQIGRARKRETSEAAIDEQMAANEVRRDRLRQLVVGYEGLRSKGMISRTK